MKNNSRKNEEIIKDRLMQHFFFRRFLQKHPENQNCNKIVLDHWLGFSFYPLLFLLLFTVAHMHAYQLIWSIYHEAPTTL